MSAISDKLERVDSPVIQVSFSETDQKASAINASVDRTLPQLQLSPDRVEPLTLLTSETRAKAVQEMARGLRYWYIDADMGNRMAELIERNHASGRYDSYTCPITFKEKVLEDLRSICPDKHLDIRCQLEPISPDDHDRVLKDLKEEDLTPAQKATIEKGTELMLKEAPPDWIRSKILPNNIGYLKIDEFPNPVNDETIIQAIKPLLGTQALIIDLRENVGGSPLTVSKVASFLFKEKTLLNRLYQRSNDQTEEFYADPKGPVFEKPIFVLVGKDTMSGGEELAYDLQATKRAKILGQDTWGGAHPTKNYVVHDHLYISIPYQRAISPYTGTNWEGTGVKPNILVPEQQDSLDVALGNLRSN